MRFSCSLGNTGQLCAKYGKQVVRHNSTDGGSLPQQARVVVCGGGVIGTSVLYHLTERGWNDVVLLEQGRLSCGTSWHAAGLVGQIKAGIAESKLAQYSRELYKKFEEEGHATGWKQCGSLSVARTKDRLITYHGIVTRGKLLRIGAELITPSEAKKLAPIIRDDDIEGALWTPSDGVVSPSDLVATFARLARKNGGEIIEGCRVENVLTKNLRVDKVQTNHGTIECEYFVNCAGMWSHQLARYMTQTKKIRVPVHPTEHFYVVTKPFGIDNMLPVIRDHDGQIYMREWSGGLLAGGFETVAKPVFHDMVPKDFEFQLLPEDWDHFQEQLQAVMHRIPTFKDAQLRHMTNGPESFTPDGKMVFGEAPEIDNYIVATGMNSQGIMMAGGIGRATAELIVDGESSVDLWQHDVKRFLDLHNNRKFLKDRVTEIVGKHYLLNYPLSDHITSRNLRTSSLYSCLQACGAIYGQSCGYERPMWFDCDSDNVLESDRSFLYQTDLTFRKPVWFDAVREEYMACRQGVALIDMSSFTKFELKSAGREVVDFLQRLCSNDVDIPVGHVIHTGMQNYHGGYENDCSIVRMAENEYFVISPSIQQTRCMKWLRRHLPEDGSVNANDVSSMYTSLNILGDKSRDVMSRLTESSMLPADFPYFRCRVIDIGYATGVIALSISHAGELGWVLYIPNEYALHIYNRLLDVGKHYGIKHAGYLALRSLRVEKLFAHWGQDLTPATTPLEAGRAFRVKFDKDFIGKEALLHQKKEGVCKRLVQLQINKHDLENDIWPWGGEAFYRNGKLCGTATSAAYGYTLNKQCLIGYVHDTDEETGQLRPIENDFILKNAEFEVEIAGKRFPAKALIYSPKLVSMTTATSQYTATQPWSRN
ncbi:PREDICTED: pyruvate dehydrogenase phosphatase regulatory subunit, mitochondrial-like isoform X2 [Priapulus caudatus]|uniref:Pyruvate dehydrogenase phosphatase regulatory subunit, mitochondrial-like isoform X2 n=1 Tax=Priapulus caudatus TaxID=37621 RepID=A0ABM1E463_PRICU|nr:PREDICTED: pyruvate dehydrogenase phosphatase regulatory subunit, mitochondrial-like isoform X2 [Priapulus caudatus]